jgi:ABC-type bacteriocin/lantibiotic exporter with double-glycine peptidase domain
MRQFAGNSGLRARVVTTSLDELRRLDLPAIVLGYSGRIRHAVALLALDDHGVTIVDPASGRKRYSIADWERDFRWTGQAILIEPAPAAPAPPVRPSLSGRRKS